MKCADMTFRHLFNYLYSSTIHAFGNDMAFVNPVPKADTVNYFRLHFSRISSGHTTYLNRNGSSSYLLSYIRLSYNPRNAVLHFLSSESFYIHIVFHLYCFPILEISTSSYWEHRVPFKVLWDEYVTFG